MKKIINKLINYDYLTKEESFKVIIDIAKGKYNNSQIAS